MTYNATISQEEFATIQTLLMKKDAVVVVSYGTAMAFNNRTDAKRFFRQGIAGSDGSERNGYCNVYFKLQDTNWKIVDDTDNWTESNQLLTCFEVMADYRKVV